MTITSRMILKGKQVTWGGRPRTEEGDMTSLWRW